MGNRIAGKDAAAAAAARLRCCWSTLVRDETTRWSLYRGIAMYHPHNTVVSQQPRYGPMCPVANSPRTCGLIHCYIYSSIQSRYIAIGEMHKASYAAGTGSRIYNYAIYPDYGWQSSIAAYESHQSANILQAVQHRDMATKEHRHFTSNPACMHVCLLIGLHR